MVNICELTSRTVIPEQAQVAGRLSQNGIEDRGHASSMQPTANMIFRSMSEHLNQKLLLPSERGNLIWLQVHSESTPQGLPIVM